MRENPSKRCRGGKENGNSWVAAAAVDTDLDHHQQNDNQEVEKGAQDGEKFQRRGGSEKSIVQHVL